MSQESFNLSPHQERLWLIEPNGPSGAIQVEAALVGPLDHAALESALRATVQRHEILRTTFRRQPGVRVPVQSVNDELDPAWRAVDLRAMSPDERTFALLQTARKELAEPFDLASGPIIRSTLVALGDERHALLLTLNALNADVSSVPALLAELIGHYSNSGELVEDPLQYADYAEWQRETIASEEPPAHEARAYWAAFWGETSPSLPFAKDASGGFAPEELALTLDEELVAAIDAKASAHGTSPVTFAQAAWHAVLRHAAGEENVVLGFVEPTIRHADLAGAVGAFARPLPVRTELANDVRFSQILEQIDRARDEHAKWGDYALAELGGNLHIGFIAVEPYETQTGQLSVWLERATTSGPHFRLWATFERPRGALRLVLRYDPRHLDAEQVRQLAGATERLLRVVSADSNVALGSIELLDPAERKRILFDFNDTALPVADRCIHELISARAATSPGRAAVVDELGSLTYAQLEARANQLANRLRSCGVGPDVAVGLCTDRSTEMIVGMLGILKAGGAYVPLHYEHPASRLAAQLATAEARVIVTQEALVERLSEHEGEVICLERADLGNESTEAVGVDMSADSLAYIIYTSGSTGTPKGVGVTHRNLVNYATDICARLGADAEPLAFGLVTSISTDLGNTSVFGSLCSGGTLVLVSPASAADGSLLVRQLEATPVDVLKITPSHIGALLAGGDSRVLPQRWLVLGGERASWELVSRVRELSAVKILNHYGPTETTVGSCTLQVPDGPGPYAPASVPIGRPIANTACYILGGDGRPAPIGVAGTLFIGGLGVARGYVAQPELTEERFIPDPFVSDRGTADADARMYSTGDLARWLPDGSIEFLGRVDEQVKIRGYRVEPGEVETALRRHPRVREAAVTTPASASGEHRLIAYCTTSGPVTSEELRAHLQALVPEFMMPAAIGVLDELPRTPSGKIDRLALPDPATLTVSGSENYVAPRTPVEEAVAAVWSDMLGVERVGAGDDFFELGGHSLLATQVIAQLRADFAVDLPLHALFISPTVEALAGEIAQLLEEDGGADAAPVNGDLAATGDA